MVILVVAAAVVTFLIMRGHTQRGELPHKKNGAQRELLR